MDYPILLYALFDQIFISQERVISEIYCSLSSEWVQDVQGSSLGGFHGFSSKKTTQKNGQEKAQEVAKKGITVNTVSPGYIQTPMLFSMKPEVLESIIKDIPIGRLGKPEEIASMVEFLAREDSGFITGANFDINGGQYYG